MVSDRAGGSSEETAAPYAARRGVVATDGTPAERLVAEAEERSRSGRAGIYDVRVTGSSDGSVVAEFRGHSRLNGGRFFTEDT